MVVGFLVHSIKHGTLKCQFQHCNPFLKPAEDELKQRQAYREKLMKRWVHSVTDDLDLVTDWWFAYKCFMLFGIDVNEGLYPIATLLLGIFTITGTISYFVELYQIAFRSEENPIKWLPLFTVVLEDAPQIILSALLTGMFQTETSVTTLETPAAFNVATSVYSALMKVSEEAFINWCYCFKFEATAAADNDEEFQPEADATAVAATAAAGNDEEFELEIN